jgi:hypothetical protein
LLYNFRVMLKTLVMLVALCPLAAVLVLAAQNVPTGAPKQGIAKKSSSGGDQKSTQSDKNQRPNCDSVSVTSPSPAATDSEKKKDDEEVQIQRKVADLTTWLVVVGALQALALVGTLFIVARQAQWMGVHAGHLSGLANAATNNASAIARQADLIEQQTSVLRDSVAAANASAKAASDNIQLLISKERARLRVEIGELNMSSGLFPVPVITKVHQDGSSDAFILDAHCSMEITDNKEPLRGAFSFPVSGLPQVFKHDSAPIESKAYFIHVFTEEEIVRITRRENFVHFAGLISYRDVFERTHNLRFNRWWNITNLPSMKGTNEQLFAFWANCGDPEDNADI